MAPMLNKGAKTPKIRVYDRYAIAYIRTAGTSDPNEVEAVVRFLKSMRKAKRWDVLDAIISRDLIAYDAYVLHATEQLGAKLAEIQTAKEQAAKEEADMDLDPLVSQWAEHTNAKYVKQVRRLIPAGTRFPSSQFTRARVSRFLSDLQPARTRKGVTKLSGETRNRYRAAISVFAKWLVERDVIPTNPVRDVSTSKSVERPIVFLEPEQVKALVLALPSPYRALEALMAATAMEWGACIKVRRRDIDLEARTIYAPGEKNKYRNRYVEATEDWAWDIVKKHAMNLLPNALLFDGLQDTEALKEHHKATKALGLPRTTLHHHRHSFAVMWIRRGIAGYREDGKDLQWLKTQLGHAPQSTLINTRYGLYINAAKMTAGQKARMSKTAGGR